MTIDVNLKIEELTLYTKCPFCRRSIPIITQSINGIDKCYIKKTHCNACGCIIITEAGLYNIKQELK